MKAIQIVAPYQMEYVDLPTPQPGADEVLLRVRASGLCHTDVNILEGEFHASYPVIPGHEFVGEVVEVGAEVDPKWMGMKVAVDPNVPCGLCNACHTNRQNQCENLNSYGVTMGGGFAEYVVVKEGNIHSIGDLSVDHAAFAEPLACVLHGLHQIPTYRGGNALILGAGPMGLLMLQSLKLNGITEVSMVDLHRERLAIATELGASQVYVPQEIAGQDKQYDIVVDATGVPAVIEKLPHYTATSGSILYFGVCSPGQQVKIEPYDIYRRDIRIAGSFSLRAGIAPALKLLEDGFIQVDKLITHRIDLEQLAEGIKLVGQASVLKVIVQS